MRALRHTRWLTLTLLLGTSCKRDASNEPVLVAGPVTPEEGPKPVEDSAIAPAAKARKMKPLVDYAEHDVVHAMDAPDRHAEAARSIGLIKSVGDKGKLNTHKVEAVTIVDGGKTLRVNLCDGTAYKGDQTLHEQASTVVMVGADLVLAAKHAVCGSASEKACKRLVAGRRAHEVVFGWSNDESGVPDVRTLDVYPIVEVYAAGKTATDEDDWAILRVSRPIEGRRAILGVATPRPGDPVFTFAHPFGTPLRYAGCATVRPPSENEPLLLQTTLDAVRGFSGAPVLVAHGDWFAIAGIHARTQSLVLPGPKEVIVTGPWKWPDDQPPVCDPPSSCCSRHNTTADDGTGKICCDDNRVRERPAPRGIDEMGCVASRPAQVVRAKPDNCRTLPNCRVDGCCDDSDDAQGPAAAGRLAEVLQSISPRPRHRALDRRD